MPVLCVCVDKLEINSHLAQSGGQSDCGLALVPVVVVTPLN